MDIPAYLACRQQEFIRLMKYFEYSSKKNQSYPLKNPRFPALEAEFLPAGYFFNKKSPFLA